MASVSPGEFFRQVRVEASKIVWPSRQQTVVTAIMVFAMVMILAFFFWGIDAVFSALVAYLLSLA